ncbi:hypothetical protein M5K25_009264 [Dendrobium thyrsiflorum]|uniref:Uncharacterized protein n=1 Tax=Dendrobium thyrsiflorum TaxID=117978 RepID=A0ABD0V5V2_DENTH
MAVLSTNSPRPPNHKLTAINCNTNSAIGNPTMSIKFSSYFLSNSAELGSTLINPSNQLLPPPPSHLLL